MLVLWNVAAPFAAISTQGLRMATGGLTFFRFDNRKFPKNAQ